MTDEHPPDWDWVTERNKCSVVSMFHTLKTLAKRDVETRLKLRPAQSAGFDFGLQFEDGNSSFSVVKVGFGIDLLVRFTYDANRIHVETNQGQTLDASLTLTNEGRCKLRVEKQELEPWQFLRLVLEPLFF